MDELKKGEQTPEQTEKEPKEKLPETPKGETPDKNQPSVETLMAQKEHQRKKREEAEERAQKLEEELEKTKKQSSTPSDEELKRKYPDWEYMEEADKTKARQEETRELRLRKLEEQLAWEKDYKHTLGDFPQLIKQEEEFKKFAYENPETKDLKILAKSFLFKPEQPEKPEERKGLEKPTGGLREVPTGDMSLGDITRLRETDPKAYFKAIREGRINKIPEK